MRSKPLGLGSAALATVLATVPALADPAPNYSAFKVGKFLSFTNAKAASNPISAVPTLTISLVAGKSHKIQVDTGSTGIVVSANQIKMGRGGDPCDKCLTYSSSGRSYSGVWVPTKVTITGGNGAKVTTSSMPVLAVTSVTSCTKSGQCTVTKDPSGIDVMGVGFGREYDLMPGSTPDKNPFLNISGPDGVPARRGYVVTRGGVHIGLTAANTSGDFQFVKLVPYPGIDGEWKAVPACIAVSIPEGAPPPPAPCGTALVDTGVTSMFMRMPADTVEGATTTSGGSVAFAEGVHLAFTFPGQEGGTPEAAYGIVVGQAGSLTPSRIVLNTAPTATPNPSPGPFVNTSVLFLNGFDILYDADGGFAAYRASPVASR